jgi:membrane protease YdiL (CAAX protease family)
MLIAQSTTLSGAQEELPVRRLKFAAVSYIVLLFVFWGLARFFRLGHLDQHPFSTFFSFALVISPYWFFGFGAAPVLRGWLQGRLSRILAALLLVLPYVVLAVPAQIFYWRVAAFLAVISLLAAFLLSNSAKPADWRDAVVLTTVALIVVLGFLSSGSLLGLKGAQLWPAGLGGFPKLMLMDLALYLYLVVKPIDGIGYDLAPRLADVKIGLREVLFYTPIVIPLGLLLGFLHFHRTMPQLFMVPAAWIFTFVFVALPEELFFRGLVQNLLERRLGSLAALLVSSVLFGLSHFNKRAVFNWRYVLLATIAGLFYGRAWRQQKRLFASSITHSTVDTIWSLWFR